MSSHLSLGGTALLIVGILLILVGIGLALFGRKLWGPFMSIAGAIVGGSAGYVIGIYYAPQQPLVGLALALLGSLLGSILFNYLVKIALALIAALIPTVLVYFALVQGGSADPIADQSAQSTSVIVAILVLLIFFSIAYYFVDELIGIVTALVGAFLFAIGIVLLTLTSDPALAPQFGLAFVGGLGLFAAGAILQTVAIRREKRVGALRAMQRASAPNAPPATPQRAPARPPGEAGNPPPPPPEA